ncbi:hypothetical protein [Anderseniella sp. Alg231-50]|uniref:hypothetical protein n=1 Tax=Anderseniella sp. Alg231-50 TaxID=1922226 RepID=UPI000D559C8D
MFRKLSAVAATALIVTAGSQIASAAVVLPGIADRAPLSKSVSGGSYKVARDTRRARERRRKIRRELDDIGTGIMEGFLALGAAAAAARDHKVFRRDRSCRRIERRCAKRHGWETRRWENCVENRGC